MEVATSFIYHLWTSPEMERIRNRADVGRQGEEEIWLVNCLMKLK